MFSQNQTRSPSTEIRSTMPPLNGSFLGGAFVGLGLSGVPLVLSLTVSVTGTDFLGCNRYAKEQRTVNEVRRLVARQTMIVNNISWVMMRFLFVLPGSACLLPGFVFGFSEGLLTGNSPCSVLGFLLSVPVASQHVPPGLPSSSAGILPGKLGRFYTCPAPFLSCSVNKS